MNIDEIQSVAKVFIYFPVLEKEAYFEKCDFDEISRTRRACNGLCIYRAIYFFFFRRENYFERVKSISKISSFHFFPIFFSSYFAHNFAMEIFFTRTHTGWIN